MDIPNDQASPRSLSQLVELYLLRCTVEGKSPQTVRAYRETLQRFLRALRDQNVPDNQALIRAEHIYAYLGQFTQLSLETRHRYFREVRCFFNWLVRGGYLDLSPCRAMRAVRLPQRIVQPFTPGEVNRLLACCDLTTRLGVRDYAILM